MRQMMSRLVQAMTLSLLVLGGGDASSNAGDLLCDVAGAESFDPKLAVPGSTHLLPDAAPAGYFVCSATVRYFADETQNDLMAELDLVAKRQLVRFLNAGRLLNNDAEQESVDFSGFRLCSSWWQNKALHGLYFMPAEGIFGEARSCDGRSSLAPKLDETPPLDLLLQGRELRKGGEYAAARAAFERLRREHPLRPESRRALYELYLTSSEQKLSRE